VADTSQPVDMSLILTTEWNEML